MRDGGHEYAKEKLRHRREGEISIVLADENHEREGRALFQHRPRGRGEVQARVGHRLERVCPLEWKKMGSLKSCTSPSPALSGPRS